LTEVQNWVSFDASCVKGALHHVSMDASLSSFLLVTAEVWFKNFFIQTLVSNLNVWNVVEIFVVETTKDELLLGQIRQNQLRSCMIKSHSLCWRVSKTSEVLFRLLSSRSTVELSGTSTVCPQQIVFGIIKLHVTLIRRIES
jgi:hypothetical protein